MIVPLKDCVYYACHWFLQSTAASQLQRKRISSGQDTPAKRKPSPIRFDSSSVREPSRKEPVAIYSPPKDKFSKKITDGSNFENYSLKKKRGGKRGGWGKKTSWRSKV